MTLAALARDEGDGSSRGSNDESEVSGSNLVEEMTVVRARENLYKQSGKMGLNGNLFSHHHHDAGLKWKWVETEASVRLCGQSKKRKHW